MNAPEREIGEERRRRTRRRSYHARPRRPWLLVVASLLLAGLAAWTGLQWRQGVDREQKLRTELRQVYLEAEQLRAQAVQAQQRAALLEKQVRALSADREATSKRVEELEARLKAQPRGSRR